jgi:hypothetical protein
VNAYPLEGWDRITEEARPLVRQLRAALTAEFWQDRSDDLEVTRTKDKHIVVRSENLWFFFDPSTGELTAGRRGEDGAEYGTVDEDGTIRWGWAVVNRYSLD